VRRPSAPGIYANLMEACRKAGFEPNVVAEGAHMLTNINLVAAAVEISLVPAAMCEINLRQTVCAPIRLAPGLAAPSTIMFPERARSSVLERFLALTRRLAGVETMERTMGESAQ
jgi:DNA-binding transcriptional LysR family regulator